MKRNLTLTILALVLMALFIYIGYHPYHYTRNISAHDYYQDDKTKQPVHSTDCLGDPNKH